MILNSLNPAQQEAVRAPIGHQLILAGAGSGKTRVLTHRIAWLIEVEKLSPYNILAVTFTNKAAHEMRSRIESILQTSTRMMWIGTFHGLSHRFLREHFKEANLPQTFQILDAGDQLRLVRRVIHALRLDEERYAPKSAQWFINAQKEEGRMPHQVEVHDVTTQTYIRIYQEYETALQRGGMVDFADLLLKMYQVLQTNPELLAHYQERFRCLLVDEFQDTNNIQYAWLKLLAGEKGAVMIVGDDDQSIYGFRGARIENIQRFSRDYPSATVIRLEQNYRSTGTILKAANAIIARNEGRLGKNLWTAGTEGDPITVYAGFNETDEAFFIVNRIRQLHDDEFNYRDIAVLYRSNAQSRVIEEALMQYGVPYRVYGGLRYFDRAEIKDALAYLRLIANPADDAAFERVINMPPRGIGDKTMSQLREQAKSRNLALWETLQQLLAQSFFPTRSSTALQNFIALIEQMREKIAAHELPKQIEIMLAESGLMDHYRKEKGEKGLNRVENLEELMNAASQFIQEGTSDELPPLSAFLAYAALESKEEQGEAYDDCVQLMTLHAAKGLEFPVVFLGGLEEELFPHYLSMNEPKAMEEERRLCYVGVTRAMRKLYLSYAEVRRMHGKESYHRPSRFLREIPVELIDEIRFRTKVSQPTRQQSSSSLSYGDYGMQGSGGRAPLFRIGQEVHHRIFGDGTVLDCEGDGDDMKVRVRFSKSGVGTKVLIASYLTAK